MARSLIAALACLATLAVPARAEAQHSLTAVCNTAAPATQFGGFWTVDTVAVATGHVRPVSTEVVCVLYPNPYGEPVVARQSAPGAVAVAAGVTLDGWWSPTICVSAAAYWSDGHGLATPTTCSPFVTIAEASS